MGRVVSRGIAGVGHFLAGGRHVVGMVQGGVRVGVLGAILRQEGVEGGKDA